MLEQNAYLIVKTRRWIKPTNVDSVAELESDIVQLEVSMNNPDRV